MIQLLLMVILVLLGLVLAVGGLYMAWNLITDSGGDMVSTGFGVFILLILAAVILLVVGTATGEIDLESVPDGCYQVINDLEFIPAGKTPILYNDRHYVSIPCPGS